MRRADADPDGACAVTHARTHIRTLTYADAKAERPAQPNSKQPQRRRRRNLIPGDIPGPGRTGAYAATKKSHLSYSGSALLSRFALLTRTDVKWNGMEL